MIFLLAKLANAKASYSSLNFGSHPEFCTVHCVFVRVLMTRLPLVLLRCLHAGRWRHRRRDLPHLHRDCVQATQRRPQETDAARLCCRQRVEEEPAGTKLVLLFWSNGFKKAPLKFSSVLLGRCCCSLENQRFSLTKTVFFSVCHCDCGRYLNLDVFVYFAVLV